MFCECIDHSSAPVKTPNLCTARHRGCATCRITSKLARISPESKVL